MEKGENTVDAADIAELMKVSKQTVYIWAKTGQVPAMKVGGRWRFFRSEVIAHFNPPKVEWWEMAVGSPTAQRRRKWQRAHRFD